MARSTRPTDAAATARGRYFGPRPLPVAALISAAIAVVAIVARLDRLVGWTTAVTAVVTVAVGWAIGLTIARRRLPARLSRIASMTGAVCAMVGEVDVVWEDHRKVLADLNRSPVNGGPATAAVTAELVVVAAGQSGVDLWPAAAWHRTHQVPDSTWSIPLASITGTQVVARGSRSALMFDQSGGKLHRITMKDPGRLFAALRSLGVPAASEPALCDLRPGDPVMTPDGVTGIVGAVLPPGDTGSISVVVTHPDRASSTWIAEQLRRT